MGIGPITFLFGREKTLSSSPSPSQEDGKTCLGSIWKGGIVLTQSGIYAQCAHAGACIPRPGSLHLPHSPCTFSSRAFKPAPAVNIWPTSVSTDWTPTPTDSTSPPPPTLHGAVSSRPPLCFKRAPSQGSGTRAGEEGAAPPRRCPRLLAEPSGAVRSSC